MSRPTDPAVTARARGKFDDNAASTSATSVSAERPWWARGPPNELALEAMLSLDEVAAFRSISPDSIRRNYPHLIRRLSPRRVGMKLRDALTIGAE